VGSNVELMLDAPAIPRVLRLLMERSGREQHCLVVEALPDRVCADAAIEALVAGGIVCRQDGLLKIVPSEEAARRIDAIMLFYDRVDAMERKKLLFRGILNIAQYACLVHVETFAKLMEAEGFARADMEAVATADGKEGLVERIKLTYRMKAGEPARTFPFVPLYYYPHFISMGSSDPDHVKERLGRAGITITEEEYLLGHYPKAVAEQAREYINVEKEHIKDRIKNEAFDMWWYYRF